MNVGAAFAPWTKPQFTVGSHVAPALTKESDMTIGRITIASLMLVGIFIGFSRTGYAQGTNLGTIRGTVTDANGAVLPNASVKAIMKRLHSNRALIRSVCPPPASKPR